MKINIKGGTPKTGMVSLCRSCQHFSYRKGDTENSEQVDCTYMSGDMGRVPNVVTECSEWAEKGTPSLRAMKEMALILDIDKKKNFGFVRYSEWQKLHEGEDLIPEQTFY